MSRHKKDDAEKKTAVSVSLSPEMVSILSHHKNRSEIISILLEENAHRLGDTSLLDADALRRSRVREVVTEELATALLSIYHKLVNRGLWNIDYKEVLDDDK